MAKRILTHPGEAHLDEIIACSLVLAFDKDVTVIERKNPCLKDFDDPDTWVLDQGNLHEPEKLNFDHHQFEFGVEECTISLIADYFKIRGFLQKIPWFRQLVMLDALGPYKSAEKQNCSPGIIQAVYTPFAEFFLSQFKDASIITKDQPLFQNIKFMGTNTMAYYYKEKSRLKLLREKCIIEKKENIHIIYFLEDVEDPFMAMHSFAAEKGIKSGVSVIKDERNSGWSLRRLFEDPDINLNLIDNLPGVIFAHASGFIAKIEKLDKPEIEKLIIKSRVAAS
jgi:uncharacterized UPF0160 family protein